MARMEYRLPSPVAASFLPVFHPEIERITEVFVVPFDIDRCRLFLDSFRVFAVSSTQWQMPEWQNPTAIPYLEF